MPQIADIKGKAGSDSTGKAPNVVGMGLRDAIYLLESQGYKVEVRGHGKISDVSINDKCVTLLLADKS